MNLLHEALQNNPKPDIFNTEERLWRSVKYNRIYQSRCGVRAGDPPKEQMITLPLHPHCRCRYDPYYRRATKRHVADPEQETMAQFREDDQRKILGSWSAWRRWRSGTPAMAIWNGARPGYPIKRYSDILLAPFKEDYLRYKKTGYFDETFETLSVFDICRRVGIDKSDIDEIAKKTNYEIEGAVYYEEGGERVFVLGEKEYVSTPPNIYIDSFIHSHPGGTSFSVEDILLAKKHRIKHIVAFNHEYFYSIKFNGNRAIDNHLIAIKADEAYNHTFLHN